MAGLLAAGLIMAGIPTGQKVSAEKADGIVTQDSFKKISKYFGNVYFETPNLVEGRSTVTSSTFGK
ncbi:hypothetical protein [Paenibacillus auburnensis]|uniref:hypothetical protein n=1 Tax=Paenibacillus auburnensis TaxID=2905649 RepID=UPI001F240484|nr:hypothetical protein [Paenibacillus auburnensis]